MIHRARVCTFVPGTWSVEPGKSYQVLYHTWYLLGIVHHYRVRSVHGYGVWNATPAPVTPGKHQCSILSPRSGWYGIWNATPALVTPGTQHCFVVNMIDNTAAVYRHLYAYEATQKTKENSDYGFGHRKQAGADVLRTG